MVLQFNYPGKTRNKEILIIPYIGDNTICMHNYRDKNLISWLSSDSEQQTRIFQFSPGRRMMLNEFNLIGIMKRQSIHERVFEDQEILAHDQQRLRYLISPEGIDYLKKMVIVGIE